MKNKYFISRFYIGTLIVCLLVLGLTGCNKFAGLPLQTDVPYNAGLLSNTTNMTTWDYIKSRGVGQGDSLFAQMYQAIIYSGIDTNIYTQPNKTFIIYTDSAIFSRTTGKTTASTSCYWGFYKVPGSTGKLAAATSWSQYKGAYIDSLKNNLLYLITNGLHSFDNIPTTYTNLSAIPLTTPFEIDTTLMPLKSNLSNPNSLISFNQSDSNANYHSIYLNAFRGSKLYTSATNAFPGIKVRTAGIVTKNGIVHVIDKVLYYK